MPPIFYKFVHFVHVVNNVNYVTCLYSICSFKKNIKKEYMLYPQITSYTQFTLTTLFTLSKLQTHTQRRTDMHQAFPSITMTKREYVTRMHKMFSHHGFIKCPLGLHRLVWMYDNNISEEAAYRVGCDVEAGYSFINSIAENH